MACQFVVLDIRGDAKEDVFCVANLFPIVCVYDGERTNRIDSLSSDETSIPRLGYVTENENP